MICCSPSTQKVVATEEEIYLAAFNIGTSFEMLGDPASLTTWWNERQLATEESDKTKEKLMRDA